MIEPPPAAGVTFLPYTTLFRSGGHAGDGDVHAHQAQVAEQQALARALVAVADVGVDRESTRPIASHDRAADALLCQRQTMRASAGHRALLDERAAGQARREVIV